MPSIMGLSSVISVQMAATPMVPAPMKRTLFFQSESAYDAMSMSAGCGATDEKYGTSTPQAMAMPSRMAMPPAKFTRKPAPSSASE